MRRIVVQHVAEDADQERVDLATLELVSRRVLGDEIEAIAETIIPRSGASALSIAATYVPANHMLSLRVLFNGRLALSAGAFWDTDAPGFLVRLEDGTLIELHCLDGTG